MIGVILQGRYRVEKKIGEGGFGKVYRGRHLELGRTVAIKVLRSDLGERVRARFKREAVLIAQLSHPNIVSVFDCGEQDGQLYLVMEYVDGPTLWELVQNTFLTIDQACAIARQTCTGMAYAHDVGLIHRDLSLANIMYEQDKAHVKIVDLGLARLLHEGSTGSSETTIGTLRFMAPELFKGQKADKISDVFSFGVGLFRMLEGRFPVEAEHPTAVMYLMETKTDFKFEQPLPDALKVLILRCLEKDPRARPQSFHELEQELEVIQRQCGGKSPAPLPSHITSQKWVRSSKRNPYLHFEMIRNPSDFFGRTGEVRAIYSRLDGATPHSVSVVGERKIGKSSLLNYLYNTRNRRRYMENHEDSVFVYLDFQSDTLFDVPKFIDYVLSMFAREAEDIGDFMHLERTMTGLTNAVQELDDMGKRVIFLMDEFDAITGSERFDQPFFSSLRSLAGNYKVAYVTSSRADLQTLCHNEDIRDSPFFNYFMNLPLGPFTADEAKELIIIPSEREGILLEPYADRILKLAGRFPFYLQLACSSVFEYLVEKPGAELNWDVIWRHYMVQAEPHYRYVWDRGFEKLERENLRRIVSGTRVSREFEFVTKELIARGYLVETEKGVDIFSVPFRDFVLRQIPKGKGKVGFLGSLFRGER